MKIPRTWTPRPYQLDLWRYLQGGGLRADVAAHRRWGKDEVALLGRSFNRMRRSLEKAIALIEK